MNWSVLQTKRFSRQYKKLHDKTASDVDAAVESDITFHVGLRSISTI